jgi:hypothetical protein
MKLRHEQGYTIQQVADYFGVNSHKARRLSSTLEKLQSDREHSRKFKEMVKKTSKCIDCGGRTGLSKKRGGTFTSERCMGCRKLYEHLNRKWNRDKVIHAIKLFAERNGRPPKSTEWVNSNPKLGYPPRSAVYGPRNDFPKWVDAIRAAGFQPYKVMNTIDYAMMLDLLDQDYTKTEAAKVLGCTASGVNMALKALEKKGLSNA